MNVQHAFPQSTSLDRKPTATFAKTSGAIAKILRWKSVTFTHTYLEEKVVESLFWRRILVADHLSVATLKFPPSSRLAEVSADIQRRKSLIKRALTVRNAHRMRIQNEPMCHTTAHATQGMCVHIAIPCTIACRLVCCTVLATYPHYSPLNAVHSSTQLWMDI